MQECRNCGTLCLRLTIAKIQPMKVSAVIIALNEEDKIGDAIRSVDWADEVLVVDAESTDKTPQIAAEMGAKVMTRQWPGFFAQKQFGVEAAENDWIFSLDADERVSAELISEILSIKENGPDASGYRIPRLAYYMGRPIRHSGWYPDWQLRFFDRGKGRWKNVLVHESVEMESGTVIGKLRGEILHYSVESAAEHHEMIGKRYAPLSARQMFERGQTTNAFSIALAGPTAFFSSYVLKRGFLDGLPGYCIARFAAHHAFLKHALLSEMQNKGGPPG
jgi:glycosyltransferase involved in cell wall biosynthesis